MADTHLHGESELLRLLAAGHETAYEQLFRAYYPTLVFFGRQFLPDKADAEDVAQNVMGKLWQNRKDAASIVHLSAYLYAGMRNGCLDWLKARTAADDREAEAHYSYLLQDDPTVERKLIAAELLKLLDGQIQALPEMCRNVFMLAYYEGLDTRATAERLGISVSNVTSQRSRALQLLKKQLLKKDFLAICLLLRML